MPERHKTRSFIAGGDNLSGPLYGAKCLTCGWKSRGAWTTRERAWDSGDRHEQRMNQT